MKRRSWIAAVIGCVVSVIGAARAEVKTWTGAAGNGRWADPANWAPAGVPGENDDAVVPGDSGVIRLPCGTGDPARISVKSLRLNDSGGGQLTELHPEHPCKGIEIVGKSLVRIGFGCQVLAGAATFAGEEGGNIVIRVTGTAARIEIGGKVIGGDGGPAGTGGVPPGDGGSVEIGGGNDTDVIVVEYDGEIVGGMGGRNPGGKGGTGGGVTLDGKTIEEGGESRGGAGGPGRTPEERGDSGSVKLRGVQGIYFPPGPPRDDVLSGDNILVEIENGRILVHDLRAYGWRARVSISLSVTFGPPGTPGDFEVHNCDPRFMDAGVDICIFGRPLLDPGVTLEGLCQPPPSTPASPCPAPFHASGFEAPEYAASAQGTRLAGQCGFAVPPGPIYRQPGHLENFNDFLNDPGNPVLPPQAPPAIGRQFIAAVNPGGGGLAGVEHAKAFTRERWRIEFAAAANFIGSSRPSAKVGSLSLEPMPGSAAFAIQGRWTDPNSPNRWSVELVHFDAQGRGPITTPVPHPAFQNLPGATWFGFGAEADFQTNRLLGVCITSSERATICWQCPPDIYLAGGEGGAPLPTGFRLGTGGGQAWGTVWAIDNLRLEPLRDSCYPDCDPSSGSGTLDVFDFLCFQNRFATQDPYACDCDTQGGVGLCDVFDFLCYQNAFAAGCR